MTTPVTSAEDAARMRLWLWPVFRLTMSVVVVVLMTLGLVLAITVHGSPIGVLLLGIGFVFHFVVTALGWYFNRRLRESTYVAQGQPRWWYARDTGEVEEGVGPWGSHRDGPYRTRDEALRAPEIARQRAAEWNAEDD